MPAIDREALQTRLASLRKQESQALANLNAIQGAIQDAQFWLEFIDAPSPALQSQPDEYPAAEAPADED